MTDLEKRLLILQRQIESLTEEIATLRASTAEAATDEAVPTVVAGARPNRLPIEEAATHVGLNRFRQLAQESV